MAPNAASDLDGQLRLREQGGRRASVTASSPMPPALSAMARGERGVRRGEDGVGRLIRTTISHQTLPSPRIMLASLTFNGSRGSRRAAALAMSRLAASIFHGSGLGSHAASILAASAAERLRLHCTSSGELREGAASVALVAAVGTSTSRTPIRLRLASRAAVAASKLLAGIVDGRCLHGRRGAAAASLLILLASGRQVRSASRGAAGGASQAGGRGTRDSASTGTFRHFLIAPPVVSSVALALGSADSALAAVVD